MTTENRPEKPAEPGSPPPGEPARSSADKTLDIKEVFGEVKFAAVEGKPPALLLSLIIGFLGVAGISLFAHWYEVVVTKGTYSPSVALTLPPTVFFLLFLLLVFINPLLSRLLPACTFRKRELLIVLGLWLITTAICYVSMVQPIAQLIGTGMNTDIANPTTKRVEFSKYLNPALFLKAADSNKYYYGIGDGINRVPLSKIPWGQWLGPLSFWIPFMLLAIVLSASLVRTMHRQWSKHELLTYPLADFAGGILDYREGRSLPSLFYERAFLCGLGLMGFIFLVNGLSDYFPLMVDIPLSYQHTAIIKSFPFIQKYCGREGYSLFRGMLYPMVVAIAVLLPTELSFSCWAGWVVMVLGTGVYFLVSGEVIGTTETGFLQAGMYIAMFCSIMFIGRKEYLAILKNSFLLKKSDDPLFQTAVVSCRMFLVCFILMIFGLVWIGLDWITSISYVASLSLMTVLLARFTAETGIPWLVNFTGKTVYLPLTILGGAALGPQSIAILLTIGSVFSLSLSTTNTIAAQETTIEKVSEKSIAPGFRKWFALILLLGASLAIFTGFVGTLSDCYSNGATTSPYTWVSHIDGAAKQITRLQVEGILEETSTQGIGSRIGRIQAPPNFWRFFLFGIVIIAFCMFMRLRFTWWPFHPLPFLLLNEWCLSRLYVSFLVGWLIKMGILRIGGGKVFTAVKPFFLGVIFGQCIIAGFWILVNVIYFLCTDTQPPLIKLFPMA